jgi:hypothetical protein
LSDTSPLHKAESRAIVFIWEGVTLSPVSALSFGRKHNFYVYRGRHCIYMKVCTLPEWNDKGSYPTRWRASSDEKRICDEYQLLKVLHMNDKDDRLE